MKPNSDFLVLAFLFSGFLGAIASPRSPLPAVPESAPLLYRADFDYIYWFTTNRADSLATDEGTLVASWSGYALERTAVQGVCIID